jgi:hypothetical protein
MNYLVKSDSKLMPKDLELYITQKLTGKWEVSEFTGFPITEGMREEVSKKVNAHCDDGCSTCKYKQFNDCGTRLTLDILSQMQPPANPNSKGPAVELPMVKTGVLELPLSDDDDFQYELITRRKTPQYEIVESFKNGDKIDITEYPELRKYCNPKSIKSSVDYSKIPVGSVVKCQHKGRPIDKVFICAKYENEIFTTSEGLSVDVNNYQNFQILQLPKQSNGETIQKD